MATEAPANPYVGPRPFAEGERLYGRRREVDELMDLLYAERIVLLHSPSGAGKSSLVAARLVPRLRQRFEVLPTIRVNQAPPVGERSVSRYTWSAIESLEGEWPTLPSEAWLTTSLADYLHRRPRQDDAHTRSFLIFDQFEEILTVEPLKLNEKRGFFSEIGEALRNEKLWALFLIREEYLGPLSPYQDLLPTGLRSRYRLGFLGLEAAAQAIERPTRRTPRSFTPAAIGKLVKDLAKVQVQQTDGSFREEPGNYVEPMHLQVVCLRLWSQMPADKRSIDAHALAQFGEVSEALAAYYAESVTRLADHDEARERAIRDWFGYGLITQGIRGQVLKGTEESAGLADKTIAGLLDTHLVRAEQRAGATWYELAHDRLIEPVRKDNAAWRAEHPTEVQKRASLWESEGCPQGLLLDAEELARVDESVMAAAHERRFLDESKKAQAIAADRERRQARSNKRWAVVATILLLIALVFGAKAWRQQKIAQGEKTRADEKATEALRQKQIAEEEETRADEKAAEALHQKQIAEDEEARADEKAAEALRQKQIAEEQKTRADEKAAEALRQKQIAEEEEARAKKEKTRAEKEKARADDLRLVAETRALAVRAVSMQEDRLAALLALQAHQINPGSHGVYNALHQALQRFPESDETAVLRCHADPIRALAISADGGKLASGSDDGKILLFKLEEQWNCPAEPFADLGSAVHSLAFHPQRHYLAAGGLDGSLKLWDDLASDRAPRRLAATGGRVDSVAFRPDSQVLTVARSRSNGATAAIELWDLAAPGSLPESLALPEGATDLRSLAFSPDGSKLVAAGGAAGVLLWSPDSPAQPPRVLRALRRQGEDSGGGGIRSVAFTPDGRFLAAGTVVGIIALWELRGSEALDLETGSPEKLEGHSARVEALAFHPQRSLLASASFDRTVRLWDLEQRDALPVVLRGDDWLWSVAFRPGAEHLVSSGNDGTLRFWSTSSQHLADSLCSKGLPPLSDQERAAYLPQQADDLETCPEIVE